MNKYASNIKSFTARNVLEQTIIPPNDFAIADGSWKPQVFQTSRGVVQNYPYSNEGNMFVHRVGLFCNFADGMVLKSPDNRINVNVAVSGLQSAVLTGTVTFTAGSKAVTGAGTLFTVETPTYLQDSLGRIYVVDTITNDTALTITDYAISTNAAIGTGMTVVNSIFADAVALSQLNLFYDIEKFVPIASAGTVVDTIAILVSIANQNTATSVEFLTKSISTDFVDDIAIFDVIAEVEFNAK